MDKSDIDKTDKEGSIQSPKPELDKIREKRDHHKLKPTNCLTIL